MPGVTGRGWRRREIAPTCRFRCNVSEIPTYANPNVLRFAVLENRIRGDHCSNPEEVIVTNSETLLPTRRQHHFASDQPSHPFFSLCRRRFRFPDDCPVSCWFRPPNRESLQVIKQHIYIYMKDLIWRKPDQIYVYFGVCAVYIFYY